MWQYLIVIHPITIEIFHSKPQMRNLRWCSRKSQGTKLFKVVWKSWMSAQTSLPIQMADFKISLGTMPVQGFIAAHSARRKKASRQIVVTRLVHPIWSKSHPSVSKYWNTAYFNHLTENVTDYYSNWSLQTSRSCYFQGCITRCSITFIQHAINNPVMRKVVSVNMETWCKVCAQNLSEYNKRYDYEEIAASDSSLNEWKSCLHCGKDNAFISFCCFLISCLSFAPQNGQQSQKGDMHSR